MTTLENQNTHVLEGFLRCHKCGGNLRVSPLGDTHVSAYRCSSCAEDQLAPPMAADELERWILRQVTETVMTDSNTRMLATEIAAAGAALSDDAPVTLRNPELHHDGVRAMATDPAVFFTPDGVADAKKFLSKLIDHITLGDQEAVVHYALPLPQDSALPSACRQHIALKHNGLE